MLPVGETVSTVKREGAERDWAAYYARTRGRPPRATTRFALEAFAREGRGGLFAVDLGCGGGRDALAILEAGHRVLAVDRSPEAGAELEARVPPDLRARLEFRLADLASFEVPPCDFVNASFVLFALEEADFRALWERVRAALRPGGRFAGHLLGLRDSWVESGRRRGVDRAGIDRLAGEWAIESLDEERCRSVTPRGEAKRWHVWHLVLRRP